MRLNRITHRGEKRISINLPIDEKITSKIRIIKGRRWSDTLKLWHIPDTRESVAQLIKLFPEFINNNETSKPNFVMNESINSKQDKNKSDTIEIMINHNDALLYIRCPFKYKDIINRASGVRWDSENRLFVVDALKSNIDNMIYDINREGVKYIYYDTDFSLNKKKISRPYEKLAVLPADKIRELDKLEKWMIQKRYAESTITDYKSCLAIFFRYYADSDICKIGVNEIEAFNYDYIIANNYSTKTQNQ